ncbi:hypothetical protein DXC80_11545 [Bacteroides uniformis]|uniref:Uncharacterized protein n=1 Tax=Bacteroides uniformis TaxID=820 RepID=A0A3E4R1I9_BACUN|nr:hypothetical protein DXC80_11545 [Bacteroides uniformis]
MPLANFCHAYGKVLPTRWQSLANGKAKPCQQGGKKKNIVSLAERNKSLYSSSQERKNPINISL